VKELDWKRKERGEEKVGKGMGGREGE